MTGSPGEKSFVADNTHPNAPPPALQPRRADATLVQVLPAPDPHGHPADSAPAPYLVLLSGAQSGKRLKFHPGVTTIGRAQDNAVVIPEIAVSRHHARIERGADEIVLRDQRSGNGTRVNGRKTKRRSLRDGDVVQVGATRLRFVDPARRRPSKGLYAAAALAATLSAAAAGVVWQKRQGERQRPVQVQTDEHAIAAAALDRTAAAGTLPAAETALPAHTAAVPGAAAAPRFPAPPLVAPPDATAAVPASASGAVLAAASHAIAASPSVAVRAAAAPARRAVSHSPAAKAAPRQAVLPDLADTAAPAADRARFEEARREGMARLAENKLPEALRALEEARRENPTPELARTIASLHVRIGLSLSATEAGLPAAAAEFRAALDDEPQDPQAATALQQIEARCRELYLRGYVAKDDDPAAAIAAFRIVISALPEADETAQKARRWLQKLDGRTLIDD